RLARQRGARRQLMAADAEVGAFVDAELGERIAGEREQTGAAVFGWARALPVAQVTGGAVDPLLAQRRIVERGIGRQLLSQRSVAALAALDEFAAAAVGLDGQELSDQAGRTGAGVQRAAPIARLFGVAARALLGAERGLRGRKIGGYRALRRN